MNWYFDTSVLVSAAVARHPHNAAALTILEEMVSRKHRGCTSAHSLTEFYAILTKTSFKPPLYPSEAWQIIESMILSHMDLVTLTPMEYQEVVRQCVAGGWVGGRIDDAVHLRCAQRTGCDRIYTFNVKDLRAMAPAHLTDKISSP
jgi:predicted nucleic acid-binding protein